MAGPRNVRVVWFWLSITGKRNPEMSYRCPGIPGVNHRTSAGAPIIIVTSGKWSFAGKSTWGFPPDVLGWWLKPSPRDKSHCKTSAQTVDENDVGVVDGRISEMRKKAMFETSCLLPSAYCIPPTAKRPGWGAYCATGSSACRLICPGAASPTPPYRARPWDSPRGRWKEYRYQTAHSATGTPPPHPAWVPSSKKCAARIQATIVLLLHCCGQLVDGGFESDEDVVHVDVEDLARQNFSIVQCCYWNLKLEAHFRALICN